MAEAICRRRCVLYFNYLHSVVKNYYLLLLLGGTSYFFNFSDW